MNNLIVNFTKKEIKMSTEKEIENEISEKGFKSSHSASCNI